MQQLLEMLQRLPDVRPPPWTRLLQSRKKSRKLALPCRWPYVLPHLIIEDDQPGRIALVPDREIEERRRNKPCVVHLLWRAGRVLHRVARIEQYHELAVRLAAIALQVAPLCAREQIPVHMAQIVTRDVGAVLGELLAEAEVRRSRQAPPKAV